MSIVIEREKEKNLVMRLSEGDRDAFAVLYDIYAGRVYNYAISLIHNESLAEDICQACFFNLWKCRKNLDTERSFAAYLCASVRNAVFNETKRRLNVRKYTLSFMHSHPYGLVCETPDRIDEDYLYKAFKSAVESLPQARRRIFTMRIMEGKKRAEIAGELGISVKTVETQMSRAWKTIRDAIKNCF